MRREIGRYDPVNQGFDRCERSAPELCLPRYDAKLLTSSKELADYYEKVVKIVGDAKISSREKVAPWVFYGSGDAKNRWPGKS